MVAAAVKPDNSNDVTDLQEPQRHIGKLRSVWSMAKTALHQYRHLFSLNLQPDV